MFTGIIETIGIIGNISVRGNYTLLTVKPARTFENLSPGESIAVDGCCLTVTAFDNRSFTVEASQESTRLTIINNYKTGAGVNLERALLPTGRLGGHFVSGHVDCKGKIAAEKKIGDSLELTVWFPREFEDYIVEKGSVALNGISLTVNKVSDDTFTVNLIPYSRTETTVNSLKAGDEINLEFDILGKYIARFLNKGKKSNLTIEKLIESGW
ncbi:MAG: riboflavin synthase [candidate division Zixibacteria bacterium HGW-Zixibacteria-1]|nr:MAG: riboflavin synthase [candidate division Zixibacteria bacterium HGW-Zixibacteria-1]